MLNMESKEVTKLYYKLQVALSVTTGLLYCYHF